MAPQSLSTLLTDFGVKDAIVLDTEYTPCVGEHVTPVCLCAKSIVTGQVWRVWYEPGMACPLPMSDDVLYISFNTPAEWSYFLAAGWELPLQVLDLYAEHACHVNGLLEKNGMAMETGLLRALSFYSVQVDMGKEEKSSFHERIMAGAPFTAEERVEILEYCWTDVANTILVLEPMLRFINPAQALARGDFMRAVAVYEYEGVPTDKVLHDRLQANWTTITANLAHNLEVEQKYGVYSFDKKGKQHWSDAAFAVLVERRGLADKWPKSPTGKYRLADAKRGSEEEKVFKHMALLDSYFEPLRQTRKILTEFKTFKLPIGSDARCRPGNIPYSQRTGRSSPKKGSIFALSAWVRWLIKPQPGRAIAYVDLVSAEFGIAAAISRDPAMMKLYSDKVAGLIEDVYLEIAKMAGAVPADAKMAEYRLVRALWKICCLMIQYGAWAGTVATMAGCSLSVATGIHRTHHELFNRYWSYIDRRRIEAQVGGIMQTRGGWKLRTKYQKAGTLGNFPVQAQAAEILQLASAHMVEDGIHLCATVHDAVLIEDSIENIDASVEKAKYWWRSASREILAYELDADVKVVRYPAVYEDKDGKAMYEMLMKLLDAAEQNQISQESVSQVLETADQDESLAEEACSYGTNSEVQGRQVRSL